MPFEPTPEQRQALTGLLYGGRKIEAIKQVRALSGLDLKDSKEFVDCLEKDLRDQHPEKFTAPSNTLGCVWALLFVLAGLGALGWLLWRRYAS